MSLTRIKDVDREILSKLDDRDLLKACSIDKYTWNTVCDDVFLKRRLLPRYPKIEKYKKENESWKQFFLRSIKYISLLKENFNYIYKSGNFEKKYIILISEKLLNFIRKSNLNMVIWSIKNGADVNYENKITGDDPLSIATEKDKNLEIVKYLVEHGADIEKSDAIRSSIESGQIKITKYLITVMGPKIFEYAMTSAILSNRLNVIKFLIENGATVHSRDIALVEELKRFQIGNYLKNLKKMISSNKNDHLFLLK